LIAGDVGIRDSGEVSLKRWPSSVTPFYTWRDLWLWLSFIAIFYLGVAVAADERSLEWLPKLLFVLGIFFGIWGIGQWLMDAQALMGSEPARAGLRATGPFGNRNHFAAFLELFLLCGLGLLGALRVRGRMKQRGASSHSRHRRDGHEERARFFLAGLGFVVVALGLVFTLSRSGITFAILGCACFALLTRKYTSIRARRRAHGDVVDVDVNGRGRRASHRFVSGRWVVALGLGVLAVALWIGVEPVIERFELLPEEIEAEQGRAQVYRESVGIIGDFWLTGSGLGSYGHVFPAYRSFGGEIFYAWAHNDYLQLGVELGVPGLLMLAWLIVMLIGRILVVREELADYPDLGHIHSGFVAALVAIGLHSFTDFSMHMPAVMALFSVIVGVVVGMRAPREKRAGGAVTAHVSIPHRRQRIASGGFSL
jgi:O-antigen ligase